MVSEDVRVPILSLSNKAAQIASVRSPRAPTPPVDDSHGVVPAARTSASSVDPPSQVNFSTTRTRAPCAVALGHGLTSATGIRDFSAVPLSHDLNSAMEVRAPNAAPTNHGWGSCALCASPRHASGSNKAVVTARRLFRRTCSFPLLPNHVMAVGLRCADLKTLFPDHEVAVGLRWGKANNKSRRYFARLDSVFVRDSSGRSILFSIKEESTRIATPSPFSKTSDGQESYRVEILLPPPRAPLLKMPTGSTGPASSSSTLTHVHQATSAPVVQEGNPALRNGPVVTPRPPA